MQASSNYVCEVVDISVEITFNFYTFPKVAQQKELSSRVQVTCSGKRKTIKIGCKTI